MTREVDRKVDGGRFLVVLVAELAGLCRFEEACEALNRLLTQETTTYEGRYQHLVDARCNPTSVQRPRPPLVIGGNGERRTLRTAARFADHWNYLGLPPEGFARKRDVLYEHCAAVGRDPSEIMLSSHVWLRDASASALDDVVRFLAADIRDTTDAAGVMLVAGIVQSWSRWGAHHGTFIRLRWPVERSIHYPVRHAQTLDRTRLLP